MRRRISPNQDSPELSKLLNCIGVICDRLEFYQQALDYKMQALEMRQRYFKKDHRDIAVSLNAVGVAYDRLNQYISAIEYYVKSLDMRYRLLKVLTID